MNKNIYYIIIYAKFSQLQASWVDVSFLGVTSWMDTMGIKLDTNIYTKLAKVVDNITAHPRIAQWIKTRPSETTL